VSQPPYGQPQYGQPAYGQQPDPALNAPVDPYYSPPTQQPGYDQSAYPGSPAYPTYGEPGGYPDPVSGYPGGQSYQTSPGYGQQSYQQPTQSYYQQPQQQPGYGGPGYPGAGYPGAPGYPTTPSGGGGGRGGVVVVLVVFLVLILVGGGVGAYFLLKGDKTTPNASGSPTPGQSQASPTPAGHPGDLRTFLIDGPSGSRAWPSPLGTDRNLSLDQASELSSDKKARRDMLSENNFKSGAVQCWIGSDRSVVDVRLYQFDTAEHADGFFKADIEATSSSYSAADTSTVPGVPKAEAYSDTKKDEQGYVRVIAIGVKADVVFVVSLAEKADKVDLTLPNRLMQQQYDKL
jgi:hypothetical protein